MPRITPAQYQLLSRMIELKAMGKVLTCASIYTTFYEPEDKAKSVVSSLTQAVRNKGYIEIMGRRLDDNNHVMSVFDLTDKGEEALARYEPTKDFSQRKSRGPEKRTGLCAQCTKFGRTYYYRTEYICGECMNSDVPVVYPSLIGSSAGWCEEGGDSSFKGTGIIGETVGSAPLSRRGLIDCWMREE